jgi:hypothetical protein
MGLTSQDWLKRLTADLAARSPRMKRFDDYYRGIQGKRLVNNAKYKALFVKLFENYAENFMGVVVDAVEERLDIEGFRFPMAPVENADGNDSEGKADADAADPDAWRIWQDNELDANSQIAHTEALVKSVSYILVSPFANERIGKSPKITVESPEECIVAFEPGTGRRLVGLKRWEDPDAKLVYATLYFPDRIEKYQATRGETSQLPAPIAPTPLPADDPFHVGGGGTEVPLTNATIIAGALEWKKRKVPGEDWPLKHDLGVVPLVPLINRPRLDQSGESELEKVIPLQDAINTLAMNELVTSERAAIPQKWATGIEIPMDPETGAAVGAFQPDVDRIISTPAPDAKFGQFEAADLKTFGDAIDRRIRRIASITRTPYHYFLDHGGQPPSGESLKSAETGLVRKASRKSRHFGERWEEVMRLAFRSLGDARGDATDAETIWAPTESMTESQHVDALTKRRQTLKVPLKQLWEDDGYSPSQIAKFPAQLAEESKWLEGTLVEPITPASPAVQDQVQERVSP